MEVSREHTISLTHADQLAMPRQKAFYITENAESQENNIQQLLHRSIVSTPSKPTAAADEPMQPGLTRQNALHIATTGSSNVGQEMVRQEAFYMPNAENSDSPMQIVRQDAFYVSNIDNPNIQMGLTRQDAFYLPTN